MATTFSATAAAPIWSRGASLGAALVRFTEGWLAPPLFLAIRLWMAEIFFRSGLLKIRNLDGAIYLFSEVHPMPLLPPWLAAYLVTTIELVCPTLLVLGLAARLAALPMLAMALVIQFVVGSADPAFYLTEHYYWMFLLAVIVTKGPGRLSVDHLLARCLGEFPQADRGRAGASPMNPPRA
jgi:putative oxidoreductase